MRMSFYHSYYVSQEYVVFKDDNKYRMYSTRVGQGHRLLTCSGEIATCRPRTGSRHPTGPGERVTTGVRNTVHLVF